MLRSDYTLLINLLQAALGKMPKPVEKELDLKALFNLSQQQEVVAIALDGLQKLSTAYNGVVRQDVQTRKTRNNASQILCNRHPNGFRWFL